MDWIRVPLLVTAAAMSASIALPADAPFADPPFGNPGAGGTAVTKLSPVLRPLEPSDTTHVMLPGPPPVTPALKLIRPVAPVPKMALVPSKLVPDPALRLPVPNPIIAAPVKQAASAAPPSPSPTVVAPVPVVNPVAAPVAAATETQKEIASFCQKQIGHWKQADARKSLGEPTRQRPAYDEKQAVNGTIFAFTDPSGNYKELELDFDRKTGNLRSVFVYPLRLTWQQCRKLWDGPVTAADANQGRKFYSYSNRHLDVLVDPSGKVISLGWY